MAKKHRPRWWKRAAPSWPGRSKESFEKALENAWDTRPDKSVQALRVTDIYITGNNPISEYSVIVTPSG